MYCCTYYRNFFSFFIRFIVDNQIAKRIDHAHVCLPRSGITYRSHDPRLRTIGEVLWKGGAEELAKSSATLNPKRARTPQSIRLFFAVSSLLSPILIILGFATGVFTNLAADLPIL